MMCWMVNDDCLNSEYLLFRLPNVIYLADIKTEILINRKIKMNK